MTQYLVTGNTFQTTDEVTAVKLNNSVNDAVLQNVDRVAMGAVSKIVTTGTARPTSSVAAGELFFDTTNDRLEVFASNGWRSVASDTSFYVTNRSAVTLVSGDCVVFDSSNDNAVTTTTTEGDTKWAGIVIEGGAVGAEVAISRGGIRTVNTTGTVTRGDFLFTSTTIQVASGDTSGDGHFGIALTTASGDTCTVALHQQAISAVPTGAIIIFNGAACPTGYTHLTNLDDKYPKGATDGTATATGGRTSYNATYLTGSIRRHTDPAPSSDSPGIVSGVDDEVQFVTGVMAVGSPGVYQMESTIDGNAGDHQHELNGLINEPAFYSVLYCQRN